jgi:hypothetical protein
VNNRVTGSALANGFADDEPTTVTVMFLYPAGDATADTVNNNHFDRSVVFVSRMWAFTVLVESANDARTVVQSTANVSTRSARMVVARFWVALSSRSVPAPGSESVVVVENA